MYFYSLVWLCYSDLKNSKIQKIIADIFLYSFKYPIYNKNDMFWDDHAVSERICVLISLKDSYIYDENVNILLNQHLDLCVNNLNNILSSDKWYNNNHRIFHLCAKFCHLSLVEKNENESIYYAKLIEKWFLMLINIETGLSVEQSVSYYQFDIQLLLLVKKFIDSFNDITLNIKINDILISNQQHIECLAFPDGLLPACGDTKLGLKISISEITDGKQKQFRNNIEKLGHYICSSPSKSSQVHLLTHNAESSHGHHSPLHFDLWYENIGLVMVDSGGPYKYGHKLRFEWFRLNIAHNTINFNVHEKKIEKVYAHRELNKIDGIYLVNNSFLVRNIILENNFFQVNEIINSEYNWMLSYHFANEIIIENTNKNEFKILKNNNHLLFKIECSEKIEIELSNTLRTTVDSLEALAPSIIVRGKTGKYNIVIRIEKIAKQIH